MNTQTHSTTTKSTKGFSLIEILIAMVVIGVGLIAVTKFQTQGLRETNMSEQRVQGINIAEEKIEQLRSQIISNAALDNLTHGQDTLTKGNTAYTRNWQVTTVGGGKQINLDVSWSDRENQLQSVSHSAVVSSSIPVSTAIASIEADPDTVLVDEITCECEKSSSMMMSGGSHSSSTGHHDSGTLPAACSTCCGQMSMMGGGGTVSKTCQCFKSGRITMM